MNNVKYKNIIWDFNGTILDDVDVGIKSTNIMLKKRNLPLIKSRGDYYKIFGFPIIDYYKRLGFDFNKESFVDMSVEWVDYYLEYVKDASVYDGIIEMLNFIKGKAKQIIISATEQNMLIKQTKDIDIYNYFDEIIGLDNIYAGGKIDLVCSWVNKTEDSEKILMLGDTYHDCDAAKKAGCDIILVAGGHQSKKQLLKCGCCVVDNVREIYKYL